MPTTNPDTVGSFEYIEAKIRRDAEGTAFGRDFEWLCKWYLENAPRYRGQFDKVWLWKDWPDRWGTDAGIDIVARTRTGELWAIQAKADHPNRAITKREIDSFLSNSNHPQFAYRLPMATTGRHWSHGPSDASRSRETGGVGRQCKGRRPAHDGGIHNRCPVAGRTIQLRDGDEKIQGRPIICRIHNVVPTYPFDPVCHRHVLVGWSEHVDARKMNV